jgi:hypothetical protein
MLESQSQPAATLTPEENEAFMKASPTREEVNRYMNNLYMAVNNSFGMYQGYTIMALAMTIKDYFAKFNLEVDKDEFVKIFFEHNQQLLKEATEALMQAKGAPAEEPASNEVDISML